MRKSVYIPAIPFRQEGRFADARTWEWDAMDATASGAQGIAGRIELRERSIGA
jgi:hypothetical protein